MNGLDANSPVKHPRPVQTNTAVISLEDDGEEEDVFDAPVTSKPAPGKQAPKAVESDTESNNDDEYLRELKRKVREKVRLRRLGIDVKHSPDAGNGIFSAGFPSLPEEKDLEPSAPSKAGVPPANPLSNLPVQEENSQISILITSIIPNTSKLIVNRRASQSLQLVKDYWCERQNFSEDYKAKVLLTWWGTKLFNSSTMVNVLKLLQKERPGEKDSSNGRTEVEAMTDEIFEYRQVQKARAQAEQASLLAEEQELREEVAEALSEPEEVKFLVKFKAEGKEVMQLKVRPSTQIGKIMVSFKQTMKIEGSKTSSW